MSTSDEKIRLALLEEKVRHLSKKQEDIESKVKKYESLISITRGAVLVVMGFGAAVLWVVEKFYVHK